MPASLTFVKGKKKEISETPEQFWVEICLLSKFQGSLSPTAIVANMAYLVSPLISKPWAQPKDPDRAVRFPGKESTSHFARGLA